jgi:hypothetical protein
MKAKTNVKAGATKFPGWDSGIDAQQDAERSANARSL